MRVIYRKIRHARYVYIKGNVEKVWGARYTLGARYLSKNKVFLCVVLGYVPSRVTSRHHPIIVSTVIIAPIPSNLSSYWWNHLISPIRVTIAPITPVSGHGRLFTMWNG